MEVPDEVFASMATLVLAGIIEDTRRDLGEMIENCNGETVTMPTEMARVVSELLDIMPRMMVLLAEGVGDE